MILAPLSEDIQGGVPSATSLPLHHEKGQNPQCPMHTATSWDHTHDHSQQRCWEDKGDCPSQEDARAVGRGERRGTRISPA